MKHTDKLYLIKYALTQPMDPRDYMTQPVDMSTEGQETIDSVNQLQDRSNRSRPKWELSANASQQDVNRYQDEWHANNKIELEKLRNPDGSYNVPISDETKQRHATEHYTHAMRMGLTPEAYAKKIGIGPEVGARVSDIYNKAFPATPARTQPATQPQNQFKQNSGVPLKSNTPYAQPSAKSTFTAPNLYSSSATQTPRTDFTQPSIEQRRGNLSYFESPTNNFKQNSGAPLKSNTAYSQPAQPKNLSTADYRAKTKELTKQDGGKSMAQYYQSIQGPPQTNTTPQYYDAYGNSDTLSPYEKATQNPQIQRLISQGVNKSQPAAFQKEFDAYKTNAEEMNTMWRTQNTNQQQHMPGTQNTTTAATPEYDLDKELWVDSKLKDDNISSDPEDWDSDGNFTKNKEKYENAAATYHTQYKAPTIPQHVQSANPVSTIKPTSFNKNTSFT